MTHSTSSSYETIQKQAGICLFYLIQENNIEIVIQGTLSQYKKLQEYKIRTTRNSEKK